MLIYVTIIPCDGDQSPLINKVLWQFAYSSLLFPLGDCFSHQGFICRSLPAPHPVAVHLQLTVPLHQEGWEMNI